MIFVCLFVFGRLFFCFVCLFYSFYVRVETVMSVMGWIRYSVIQEVQYGPTASTSSRVEDLVVWSVLNEKPFMSVFDDITDFGDRGG